MIEARIFNAVDLNHVIVGALAGETAMLQALASIAKGGSIPISSNVRIKLRNRKICEIAGRLHATMGTPAVHPIAKRLSAATEKVLQGEGLPMAFGNAEERAQLERDVRALIDWLPAGGSLSVRTIATVLQKSL